MTDKLVTIAGFQDINQAAHAQMHLESAGIDSFLEEGDMATMMPFVSTGFKLKVRESNVSKANDIMAIKDPIGDNPEESTSGLEPCPQCGSTETYFEKMAVLNSVWHKIITLLFPRFRFRILNRLYCFRCKHKWESKLDNK
jgi:DNA-directed RNA polymerase subunit M/transcription elongation factor TFIIS